MDKRLLLCVDSRDTIDRVLAEIRSIAYLSDLASEQDGTPLRGLSRIMDGWADALSAVADRETQRAEDVKEASHD